MTPRSVADDLQLELLELADIFRRELSRELRELAALVEGADFDIDVPGELHRLEHLWHVADAFVSTWEAETSDTKSRGGSSRPKEASSEGATTATLKVTRLRGDDV